MPVDTQNQSAVWWAEQAQRYKAETALLQRKYDELVQSSTQALKDGIAEALNKQQEALVEAHLRQVKRLGQEYDQVVQQLLQEPVEARQLREEHAKEARAMALKQSKERSELISQIRGAP